MSMHKELLKMVLGFEWDEGNKTKNLDKHAITIEEAEQIFTNDSLALFPDEKHSSIEQRFGALGVTNNGRELSSVFTVRAFKIRVISIRPMSKKERKWFNENKAK